VYVTRFKIYLTRSHCSGFAAPGGRRKRGADGAQKEETHQSVVNSAIIFPMGKDVLKSNQKLFGKQAITGLTLTGDLDDLKREQQRQVFADLEVATHCMFASTISTTTPPPR
jgi:hypothetical protein